MVVRVIQSPVYNAMNKRLLYFGIERHMFWAVLCTGVFIFYKVGLIVAVVAATLMYLCFSFMTRKDPKLPEVFMKSGKLGYLYDSALKQ